MTNPCPTCASRHAPGPCAAAQMERVELRVRPLSDSARRRMAQPAAPAPAPIDRKEVKP